MSWPWSHLLVLNMGLLDCNSSALTTRPLLHKTEDNSTLVNFLKLFQKWFKMVLTKFFMTFNSWIKLKRCFIHVSSLLIAQVSFSFVTRLLHTNNSVILFSSISFLVDWFYWYAVLVQDGERHSLLFAYSILYNVATATG